MPVEVRISRIPVLRNKVAWRNSEQNINLNHKRSSFILFFGEQFYSEMTSIIMLNCT